METRTEQSDIPATYQPYQQELFIMVSKVTISICILGILVNSLWFLWDPIWRTLIQNSVGLLTVLIFWWCLKLAHQGRVQQGARIYLASAMFMMSLMVITAGQLFIVVGLIGFCLFLLIATFLEPPDVALGWGGISILLYLGALTLRSFVPIFEFEPEIVDLFALYMFPTLGLIAFVLLGRNMTRLLNTALVKSQAMQRDLKRREEALRKLNEQLEARVLERTAELRKVNAELVLEITERMRAEEQINASLQEKEVLLKEIHHRVKNNLQVISSLLNLQAGYVQDQRTIEIFRESQHRIRSMALVHEKLYQSQDLARIDFAQYIQSLVTYLARSYGADTENFQFKIKAEEICLSVDVAISCGLILNELVSNALKHAYLDGSGGEILIELSCNNDQEWTLRVSDNGVGFPEELDFRHTTSLGLQLVNTLVDQLDGTIELDSSDRTEFRIRFTPP